MGGCSYLVMPWFGHHLPAACRWYLPKKAETKTHKVRLMDLCAVSGEKRIGLWEMVKGV